jgi:hypothetical protein
MAAADAGMSLIIEMGLDTEIRFVLSGNTLTVGNQYSYDYGGIGTHYDLENNYPDLYFGSPMCYADGKLWDLTEPLRLGFTPAKIAGVELLESGRSDVSVGDGNGMCSIVWTDDHVDVVDNEGSSSRYLIKINFR